MLSEEYGLKTIDGFTTSLTYSLSVAIIKQPLLTASISGRPKLSFKEGNIRIEMNPISIDKMLASIYLLYP